MAFKEVRLRALRDAPFAFTETLADVAHEPDRTWIDSAAAMASDDATSVVFLGFADDLGPAVGMAGGRLHRERDDEAVVWGVWVDPAARGSGLGRELVGAVIGWAKHRGRKRVGLCVTETSVSAIALYRALGFEEVGERRPYKHQECSTEISMARPVTLA